MYIKDNIINGKYFADKKLAELAYNIALLKRNYNLIPTLAIVQIGQNVASNIYIKNKLKAAETVGVEAFKVTFSENIKSKKLLAEIKKMNNNKAISGIIVQLPLPLHIDKNIILSAVNPKKDVDGFNPINIGYLHSGSKNGFVPCTALGVLELLKQYEPNLSGKNTVIIGRSDIVGKPLAALLLKENCTVTICHSKTKKLRSMTYTADIVVAATGVPWLLSENDFNSNAIVIDVGINRLKESNSVVGDVNFQKVHKKVRYITPVPGGVGPMTVAFLLANTLQACYEQHNIVKLREKTQTFQQV